MKYLGEHLWIGIIGQWAVLLAFTASLFSLYAYVKALLIQRKAVANQATAFGNSYTGWITLGRNAFYIQTLCIITIFSVLFFALATHKYEYFYVFNHSSNDLEPKYLLSCFWEGMEGSFLLWSFWNSLLGVVLTRTAKYWESPVMTVFAATQIITASFTLGIYLFDLRIGSNPFVLLRNETAAPIFQQANYLSQIKDGNGLNALLQNYWMVIHPPVLFLGFSSVLVPFAYATGSLLLKDFKTWVKPVLPWALFSTGILGLGIMMGAMWAYESLNFGGFWAWDPVENASMVPWLVAVSGIHTALIYKSTGRSLRSTYVFMILAYVLVLYSSFLTKSGILQNSSVHAFTDKGASIFYHLLIKVLLYLVLPFVLFFKHLKKIPVVKKEEHISSREFWMFIGSLLFFTAGMIIIIQTSWPAIGSKLMNALVSIIPSLEDKVPTMPSAMGENQEYQYNKIQIWIAIFAGLFTAVTQYLKYKNTESGFLTKKIWGPTVAAIIIAISISVFGGINYLKYGAGFMAAIHVAIFAAVYATVANASYIVTGIKGKLSHAGGSIAHVGFGILLIGILVASAKKTVVSYDTTLLSQTIIKDNPNEKANENITLIKGMNVPVGKNIFERGNTVFSADTLDGHKYVIGYTGKTKDGNRTFFDINFQKISTGETFTLSPHAIDNNKGSEGVSSNPDAKHYWNKDLFVYLTYISEPDATKDTSTFKNVEMGKGDTIPYTKGSIVLEDIIINKGSMTDANNPLMFKAKIRVLSNNGTGYVAEPSFKVINNTKFDKVDSVIAQNLAFVFAGVNNENKKVIIGVKESDAITDFVTMKIYEFPFINAVWAGTLLIVAGFMISVVHRIKQLRRSRLA
jgi:cytochrome c-type biogenesis protein CcmF